MMACIIYGRRGQGPIRSDLAAAVTSAAAPSIVVPYWPSPKEPS